jgi:hypothetical protein
MPRTKTRQAEETRRGFSFVRWIKFKWREWAGDYAGISAINLSEQTRHRQSNLAKLA